MNVSLPLSSYYPQLRPSRWLAHYRPRPSRMRLFCLPYAGGSAAIYKNWQALLPDIEVCPVELPGRGARFGDPLSTDLSLLVEDMTLALHPLTDMPFAVFGHSMGAVLAFELTRALIRRGRAPQMLVCAGRHPPHKPSHTPDIHTLSDQGIIERLREMGGTPVEILDNPELLEVFLPTLRADFTLHETYRFRSGPSLDVPLHIFGAAGDSEAPPETLRGWEDLSARQPTVTLFEGDHFFVQNRLNEVIAALRNILSPGASSIKHTGRPGSVSNSEKIASYS